MSILVILETNAKDSREREKIHNTNLQMRERTAQRSEPNVGEAPAAGERESGELVAVRRDGARRAGHEDAIAIGDGGTREVRPLALDQNRLVHLEVEELRRVGRLAERRAQPLER